MIDVQIKTDFKGAIPENKYRAILHRELRNTMELAVQLVESEVVRQTKKHNLIGVTRALILGIYGRRISHIYGRVGVQGPAAVYGEVMEKGRRPGSRMPPPEALERWVYLKLRVARDKVKSTAFLVARSIQKKGIKGRHFFRKAEKIVKPRIMSLYDRVLRELEKKLGD